MTDQAETRESLRIIRMEAQAVKRLKAAAIEPDPDKGAVVVSGPNGNGKSSLLDSIFYALCGGRNIPDEPVQDGEETAHVKLELGDDDTQYVVTRRWDRSRSSTGKNGQLEIRLADGSKPDQPPQKLLNSMLADITFDPSEFLRMTASEQREALIQTIDLPIDLDELEAERSEFYQERRDVNRDLKKVKGKLDSMKDPEEDLPDETVDVSELNEQLQDAHAMQARRVDHEERITDINHEIDELKKRIAELEDERSETQESLEDLPDEEELQEREEDLKERINSAQETNEAIRDARDYRETRQEVEELEKKSESLTNKIESIDQTKEEVLAEVELPDPNIGFTEDGLTYDGKPFEQAAMSEQLRVAVAIGMSSDPQIRIVRLKEGSFLDRDNLDLLDELARDHDFQAWVEYVDQKGDLGIYIEDGNVAALNNGHKAIEGG